MASGGRRLSSLHPTALNSELVAQRLSRCERCTTREISNGDRLSSLYVDSVNLDSKERLPPTHKTLLSLSRQQADAILAADQAEKKKQDMIDKLAITKGELDHHEHYLAQIKSSLTITSPTDGYFKALVAAGGAVKKGHILGEMK
jgi:hypothetical protein